MKVPASITPSIWSAVIGAIAISIVGFWGMGWHTEAAANRMASDRADAAVIAALVPFCVAKAELDPDQAKLTKIKAEESSYSRTQLVSDSGWATMLGKTAPDRALAAACADKLKGPAA